MLTRAEGQAQKKEIRRQIERELKAKARAKVRELRAQVREARGSLGKRIREARALCRRHGKIVRERARARRRRLLEELRQTERAERLAARDRCGTGKARARAEAKSTVERARLVLEEERRYQAELHRIEQGNRAQRRAATSTRAERRSESDDEVEGNLPPELVPLWRRVRATIRGSSRQSRTEAFLQYAHNHPREIVDAQEAGIDDAIAEMERRANEAARFARKRRYTAAELAEVPF